MLILVAGNYEFSSHLKCKEMRLNHMLFADDLILFSKVNNQSIQALMMALKEYAQTSGLHVSKEKSQILGVHISSARFSKSECASLVDKITTKVRIWSARNISYAGRCVLSNSILIKGSIFIMLQQLVKDIETGCNDCNYRTPPITYEKLQKKRIPCGLGGSMTIILKTQYAAIFNQDQTHAGIEKTYAAFKTTYKRALYSTGVRGLLQWVFTG
ncbi:hypothetical protein Cgig2_021927 [Carnegiea gigantea]|uniref:Reverse transcriptase domain-containing protein n=1 Tax=Carnegiea gigantea TaxID=171969 RepID=A0A9Q1JLN8_9CARY|nr:hypothetical protein Cgig2_021927 [Carnegiea gigantea]